jgi:capsid portal protein
MRLSGDVPINPEVGTGVEANPADRQIVADFLESAMPNSSFQETLMAMWQDVESLGQGYLEISREKKGGKPDGIYHMPSVTVKILQDGTGFVHTRGGKNRLFARYQPKGIPAANVKVATRKRTGDQRFNENKGEERFLMVEGWVRGAKDAKPQGYETELLERAEKGSQYEVSTNELLMFKKPTPYDTNYGEPDIISVMYDAIGGQLSAIFNMDFFERNAVPRLMIIAQGGVVGAETIARIQEFVNNANPMEVLNQILLIDVADENTKITVEPIGIKELSEASFLDYRKMTDEHIMRAHLTPPSMVAGGGEGTAADFRFIAQVVRPSQRTIETRINYLIDKEFNIQSWCIDLPVPDLLGDQTRSVIFDTLLRRGALTIDEVRSQIGLGPIPGGDIAFILVPGSGAVPVEGLLQVKDAIASGVHTPGDITATSNKKTPETTNPVFKAVEIADVGRTFDAVTQQELALILEQLGADDPRLVIELLPECVLDALK